ncbi:hypothetical protein [Tateyamaria sp. Alg231-49]|uniref:hypothetical protein n=1 Tax=Tateyamaria sp. Alg231-49 TaxID=1922219 RepID=UPI00131F187F|nr:hypothetical protein [Tateyamaria sp. Alg231-49]
MIRAITWPTTFMVAASLFLGVAGCDVAAPATAVDDPDPDFNFVRSYRSPSDECQLVGESAFTVDFLDDAADLVACPTGSEDLTSLIAETETAILTQTQSYSLVSVPRR